MRKVVFVCIGNACRSQMAEGFARAYGRDVMDAWSAGIYPASAVPEQTLRIMQEKNLPLQHAFTKHLDEVPSPDPEIYVNMSGLPIPGSQNAEVRVWTVKDPYQSSDEFFRQIRDQIEGLVMGLIMELRQRDRATAPQSTQTRSQPSDRQGAPGRRGWRRGL